MPNFYHCLLLALLVGASALPGQCANIWRPGFGPAGTDFEVVAAIDWDPDGVGPLTRRPVCAGRFTIAGTAAAMGIASLDPATGEWTPFGTGMNGWVLALAELPNGDLVAGGLFTTADGAPASSIARWNGNTWAPLGSGTAGSVLALSVLPGGDLVAGGAFNDIGNNVARWNGTAWLPLGVGTDAAVLALRSQPGGNLVVGGVFAAAGGLNVNGIAAWNGVSWSGFGAGCNGTVNALAILSNGDLVAGGAFTIAGTTAANRIARWTGAAWSAMGQGCNDEVRALATLGNGELLTGGAFTNAGGAGANGVARWDGSSWFAFGTAQPMGAPSYVPDGTWVNTLWVMQSGLVVAGGSFSCLGGVGANNVALTDRGAWRVANPGTNAPVYTLMPQPNGTVIAGGAFKIIDGVVAAAVARWDGTTWSPLGGGINDTVRAVTTLPNGDVIVGGTFNVAGGSAANNVARWNGVAWTALGAGTNGEVRTLATLPNGDLVAGGTFNQPAAGLARWNGTAWSALGGGLAGGTFGPNVAAALTRPNGDLVVCGEFSFAGGAPADNIARWNGGNWSTLGTGILPWGRALATLPNGDLVVGGALLLSTLPLLTGGLARWDGSTWSAFGPATPGGTPLWSTTFVLGTLPNGDLVAGGLASSSPTNKRLARWNGTAWTFLVGSGTNSLLLYDDNMAVAASSDGDLLVGGLFTRAGGQISAGLARVTTNCPATAVTTNFGCTSTGGSNRLLATTLPWIGTACRLRSDGLPSTAIIVAVSGLSPTSLPLSTVFSQAGSGCTLQATPDFVDFGITQTGAFDYALVLPSTTAIVGLSIYHQHVPLELNVQSQISSVTATDTLQLTIGSF
ncbi:MAG: hypothetical protein ABIP94_25260 [Planctomycetota bacterium]